MENIDAVKKDLADYRAQIDGLNKKLEELEAQKQNILRVGTRLEGIVAYLTGKLKDLDAAVLADAKKAETIIEAELAPSTSGSAQS